MRLGDSSLRSGAVKHTVRFSLERVEMRRTGPRVVCSILLFVAAGLSACAAERPPAPPEYTPPVNATLQSVTEAVLADASKRTGLEVAKLEVVESIVVTWPDGSLGCPEPGMNYTMALVPGYRIRIKADQQVLNYHASARGYWVFCPVGRAVDPAPRDAI